MAKVKKESEVVDEQPEEPTELATTTPPEGQVTDLAIPPDEMTKMFGESTLDLTTGLSFNQVGIMKESAQFDLGNEVYVNTIIGFVLFKHRAAQWWAKAFDDRTEDDDPRPQCFSIDGRKPAGGLNMQAETCSKCKWDKYKSDRKGGKGKDCRNTIRLLFLQDGAVIPVVITAPPTSLSTNVSKDGKGFLQKWLNKVPNDVAEAYNKIGQKTKKGLPIVDYWWARVELSLQKRDFGKMIASLLVIKTKGVVTPKSDATMVRHVYQTRQGAVEQYKAEQLAYIESEAVLPDDADAESAEYNEETDAAGGYKDPERPI